MENETTTNNINELIESQKICDTKLINNKYIEIQNKALLGDGTLTTVSDDRGVTNYIDISKYTNIINTVPNVNNNNYFCTYKADKTKSNCYNMNQYNNNNIAIQSNEKYARFTIINSTNIPQFELTVCQNGNQALYNQNIGITYLLMGIVAILIIAIITRRK